MVMNQAEDDSLSMIPTVKMFSREETHLGEQSDALDQYKALSLRRIFYGFIMLFIGQISDSFSFSVSLLLLVYNSEELDMDAGKNKSPKCEVLKWCLHSIFRSSDSLLPAVQQDKNFVQLYFQTIP